MKAKHTTIILTEENRELLKMNKFKTDESFSSCINRLVEKELKETKEKK